MDIVAADEGWISVGITADTAAFAVQSIRTWLDRMGRPRPDGGAAEVMAEVRRLYFDLALSATPVTLNALLALTDPSHILFGADYPFAPPPAIAGNPAGFDQLMAGLSPDQQNMINFETAQALFPKLRQAGGVRAP